MVEIHYFASIADAIGKHVEIIDLPEEATLADLRETLAAEYGPQLENMLGYCQFLIGDELTRDPGAVLSSRVDVMPPFAGG